MSIILLVIAIIIFVSVMLNRIFKKLGIPVLLSFIALGMVFNSEELFKIELSPYNGETICLIALIFIMFYGGFGTNWKKAKKIARESVVMSSAGVVLTSAFVCLFAHYVCKMDFKAAFLMGAVVSSTDAASVFSVLKSKKLSLKYKTASLLEVESGSNDPFAYMLTVIGIEIYNNDKLNTAGLIWTAFSQLIWGIVIGVASAYVAVYLLRKINIKDGGFDLAFIVGIAVFSFSLASVLGGNGYLATYLTGIIMGNRNFKGKSALVKSLEGLSSLTQIVIFFLLGLMVFLTDLIRVPEKTWAIAIFLIFVARPITVYILMKPFKMKKNQRLLISFAGLRGASAIVFSMMVVNQTGSGELIFDTTFAIVLLSIVVQGSLLPLISKRLNMIDENEDVLKTFNDYMEEIPIEFITMKIPKGHSWVGKSLSTIDLPPEILVIIIMRGKKKIVPNGDTQLLANDKLIISAVSSKLYEGIKLFEMEIDRESGYIGKQISQLDIEKGELVILIKRKNKVVIPQGSDMLLEGDVLVLNRQDNKDM